MPRLSLIIPCYNEAKNLPFLVERCARLLAAGDIEIVLVDNGSTDESPRVLESLLAVHPRCRAIRVPVNQGYGYGILAGLRAADGDILGWTHADLQTDPMDALDGLRLFDAHGPDCFVKGKRHGRPIGDRVFTFGMSIFETLLLGKGLYDINAQPTMFPKQFFTTWQEAPHDFSLDLYAYYMACRQGLAVRRFPVRFGERAHGVSHWNVNWAAKRKFIRRTIDYSLKLKRELAHPSR
jgi:glycosyltransferase involved in cell wall biosynthesis